MIYIYGDSHAERSFKNLTLPHANQFCNAVTMFRIGRDNIIINFDKNCIQKGDTIILVYGEIDCRCHIQKQLNLKRNENDIIYELVNHYINTIQNNTMGLDIKIIIVGVIPPVNINDFEKGGGRMVVHEHSYHGSDEERVRYTLKVNNLLEELSNKNNFIYFNPYNYYTSDDGTLKFEFSDHNCHIGDDNTHILEKFIELYEKL